MTAQPGYLGSLKIGSSVIQLLESADLALAGKNLATTSLGGNGWETSIMGILSGKVSAKGCFDQSDTNGQAAVQSAFFNRTLLSGVVFTPDGIKNYTFNCWVTDYKPAAPVQDKATIDFTLMVTSSVVAS